MAFVGNAHIVAGDAAAIEAVLGLVQKEGIQTEGNPDMYTRSYPFFGVEDARELRERALLSAVGERRVFIVAAPSYTTEAQNALLKTLEEAPGNALFFLIVPNPETLLPTVRSRSQTLSIESAGEPSPIESRTFLAAAPSARLEMLKPLLEKGDDDRRDMAGMLSFLANLEKALAKKAADSTDALHAIYRARKYLGDKGSLVKPLLEQVALLVPIMK